MSPPIFGWSRNRLSPDERAIAAELREAIRRDELVLNYQPVFDVATGEPVALEALVRWLHPTVGMVRPGAFMSVAERGGLAVPLGECVLAQACFAVAAWVQDGLVPVPVTVNLSDEQVSDRKLARRVAAALTRARLDGRLLQVEVSDALFQSNLDATVRALRAVCEVGVGVVVDDFGRHSVWTGYSHRLGVVTVKVDVSSAGGGPERFAAVEDSIRRAHSLGLVVTGKRAESYVDMGVVRALRCDRVQGHAYSEPLDPVAVRGLLASAAAVRRQAAEEDHPDAPVVPGRRELPGWFRT